jgi:hypothetical protein
MKLLVYLGLALASALSVDGAVNRLPCKFAALPSGDYLVVRLDSQGCWIHNVYEFKVTPIAAGQIEITEIVPQWSKTENRFVDTSRSFLGKIELQTGEAEQLDRLISYYRSTHKWISTNQDTLLIQQFHEGKLIGESQYTDRSGELEQHPELLTFQKLVAALKKTS